MRLVSLSALLLGLRPARSPMERPVSRRERPASAGRIWHASECVVLERTVPTVPLTPRHVPATQASSGPSSGFVELASAAPPCRRAACPEQGRLPPTGLSGEESRSHPGLAFRPESRPPNPIRPRLSPRARRSRHRLRSRAAGASSARARLSASAASCHDPRPLPRFQSVLAIR